MSTLNTSGAVGMTVTPANLGEIARLVAAGQQLFITSVAPTGYVRQFQHQDWVDFVDPVQAGGNNGFNERFHALEHEFDLIATAVKSVDDAVNQLDVRPPALGMTVAVGIANGAQIPVPNGFDRSECRFFAFPKWYELGNIQVGNTIGFMVYADDQGVVTAQQQGRTDGVLSATGVAIARKGGW